MNDLIGKVTDVHRTLAYGRGKLSRRFLEMGLVCLGLGAVVVYLETDPFTAYDWIMLVFTFLVGGGTALYGLFRLLVPGQPLLVMAPAGLRLHIEWVKTIVIPWHEVRGVDTIDITGRFRGHTIVLTGVTVVLVSRSFYDRHIHIDSWVLRGPGWDTNFIPKGDMVQVALQHEALPASAAELRAAVEARWRAFRDAKPVTAGRPQASNG